MILCCFVIPSYLPKILWDDTVWNGYFICALLRYCWTLHVTWLVNSAAHMFGYRPYDITIEPRENHGVSLLAVGEGYHNYHHTFPWDYQTAELGSRINLSRHYIDLAAALGLAYDRKTVSQDHLTKRIMRTGQRSGETSDDYKTYQSIGDNGLCSGEDLGY